MERGERKDVDQKRLEAAYAIEDNNPKTPLAPGEAWGDNPGSKDTPGQLSVEIPPGATQQEIAKIVEEEHPDLIDDLKKKDRFIAIGKKAVYVIGATAVTFLGVYTQIKLLEHLSKEKEDND